VSGKIGILLVNLGTPEATSFWPMRRYLKEFLSDRRVVENRGPVWWFVLNAIILTRRPVKSGRAYAQIWNTKRGESPLKTISRAQAEKVDMRYADDPRILVDWAMRYGEPPIAETIIRLKEAGCERVLLFPLYPQYSAATTASAMDKVFDALKTMRWQPAIRSVPPYFDHPAYIDALARSIRAHRDALGWTPEVTLASLHGLPKGFIDKGDPYQRHCERTVELLRDALGLGAEELLLTYQSRSGRVEWLGPDTEDTIVALARKGVRNLLIVTPGFASDCVETLEEIQIRAAQSFLQNGGENFSLVPCLNESANSIHMLCSIIDEQLQGWV